MTDPKKNDLNPPTKHPNLDPNAKPGDKMSETAHPGHENEHPAMPTNQPPGQQSPNG